MAFFDHPEFRGHEKVSFFHDRAAGLKAIIAIHSTALSPVAAGGIRMRVYGDDVSALGRAIECIQGRYIAGEDVGATTADMNEIAKHTKHVAAGDGPDTAPYTALGVYLAMRAAAERKLGRKDLAGVSVALQGVGKVAHALGVMLARIGETARRVIDLANKKAIGTGAAADRLAETVIAERRRQ